MLSTSQHAPKRRTSCFGFGNGWESFGNTHPKGRLFIKKSFPLSIADVPYISWLRSHVYRSYPHIALLTMQTRTQGFAPLSTRSLSLHCLYLCEGFPNVQLNKSYVTTPNAPPMWSSPVSGLAFRLLPYNASDTYSYHTLYVSNRKMGVQK